jgi:hypothetical protein
LLPPQLQKLHQQILKKLPLPKNQRQLKKQSPLRTTAKTIRLLKLRKHYLETKVLQVLNHPPKPEPTPLHHKTIKERQLKDKTEEMVSRTNKVIAIRNLAKNPFSMLNLTAPLHPKVY